MTQYEQDPINKKFYPVAKEKGFTDAEWEAFCEKWGHKQPPKKKIDWEIVFITVFMSFAFGLMVQAWVHGWLK